MGVSPEAGKYSVEVRDRGTCHADLYTVSRCCTRDESQEFIVRR